jgi:hypothetical protein
MAELLAYGVMEAAGEEATLSTPPLTAVTTKKYVVPPTNGALLAATVPPGPEEATVVPELDITVEVEVIPVILFAPAVVAPPIVEA